MEEVQENSYTSQLPESIIQRLDQLNIEQTWLKITVEDKAALGDEAYQFLKHLKEWKERKLPQSQLAKLVLELGVDKVHEHISAIEINVGQPKNSGTNYHFHYVKRQYLIHSSGDHPRKNESVQPEINKTDFGVNSPNLPITTGISQKAKNCSFMTIYFICSVLGDFISISRRIQPLYTIINANNAKLVLEKLLKGNRYLKNVKFSNNVLEPNEFEHLVDFLANSAVEEIEFDSTNIVVGMGKFAVTKRWHNFMRLHPSVHQLSLFPEQALPQPTAHVLRLAPAQLISSDHLVRFLSNINRCVTSLRIEGFDSSSLVNLLQKKDVVEIICEHPAIRDITLFNNTFDDSYGVQLIDMIPRLVCPNIESLAIENCRMSNFHLQNLLRGLASQNVTLSRFSLANNPAMLNKLDDPVWGDIAKLQLKNLNLSNTFNPRFTYNMTQKTFSLISKHGLEVLDISHNGGVRIQALPSLFKDIFNATHLQALHMDAALYSDYHQGSVPLGFDIIKNISHHPDNNLSRLTTLSFCGYAINRNDSLRLTQMLRDSRFSSLSIFRISSVYYSNCTNYVPLNFTGVQSVVDICFPNRESTGNVSCFGVNYSLFMHCPSSLFCPDRIFDIEDHAAFAVISDMPGITINFDSNKPCGIGVGIITNNITVTARWSFDEFSWFQKIVDWWGRPIFRFEQFDEKHSISLVELEEFPYICKYRNITRDNVRSSRFSSTDSIRSLEYARTYADDCPAQVTNNMITRNAISQVQHVSIFRGICDGLFQNSLCSELVFVLGSIAPLLVDSYYNVASSYDFYSITPFIVIPTLFRLISTVSVFKTDASFSRIVLALLPLPIYFYRVYQEGLWSIITGILMGLIFQQAGYTAINDTKWLINEKWSRKVTQQESVINMLTIPIMCAHECVSPSSNITDGIIRYGLFATAVLHSYRGPTKPETKARVIEPEIHQEKQRSCPLPCAIL